MLDAIIDKFKKFREEIYSFFHTDKMLQWSSSTHYQVIRQLKV